MLQLDQSLDNFEKICFIANQLLVTKELLLKVYERRDKFCYIIGVHGKNKNLRDFSSCVFQKFNGYDILKSELKNEEKQFHELIDIIYEPVNDESSVKCFFTDNLHLAYRS